MAPVQAQGDVESAKGCTSQMASGRSKGTTSKEWETGKRLILDLCCTMDGLRLKSKSDGGPLHWRWLSGVLSLSIDQPAVA